MVGEFSLLSNRSLELFHPSTLKLHTFKNSPSSFSPQHLGIAIKETRTTIGKWDLMKSKHFYLHKEIVNQMKR